MTQPVPLLAAIVFIRSAKESERSPFATFPGIHNEAASSAWLTRERSFVKVHRTGVTVDKDVEEVAARVVQIINHTDKRLGDVCEPQLFSTTLQFCQYTVDFGLGRVRRKAQFVMKGQAHGGS